MSALRLSFRAPFLPFLALLFGFFRIPAAEAVHCLELFEMSEPMPFAVAALELLETDEKRIVTAMDDVLDRPVSVQEKPAVSLFKSTSDETFQLYAVDGVRFREPREWTRVEGFSHAGPRPEVPKLEIPDFSAEIVEAGNKIMPANDHSIVAVFNNQKNIVRIASSETVVGAYRLPVPNKPFAIVLTHQREAPVGFGSKPGLYSTNLYVVSDTGYQWLRLRTSGRDSAPKIALHTGPEYGLVLNVDGRPYQLLVVSPDSRIPEAPVFLPEMRRPEPPRAQPNREGSPQASADLLFPMRR